MTLHRYPDAHLDPYRMTRKEKEMYLTGEWLYPLQRKHSSLTGHTPTGDNSSREQPSQRTRQPHGTKGVRPDDSTR
jgi:hypothetical protein